MSFPKLPKTPLDTNEFNYSRWDNTTCIVKLCSVPWQENYENVVEFSNKEERDQYFNNLAGNDMSLNSGFRVVDNFIKVPIPYFNAIRYNYIVIDYPIPTSENMPVDYANLEPRTFKYFYFIKDIEDLAPNTVRINLQPDVWQQWYYDLNIKALYLRRGHYAIHASATPTQYLNNPIANTDFLLTPEFFNISQKQKQGTDFIPYFSNDSDLYAVFTLPFDITDLVNTNVINNYVAPTFSSDSARNGYEAIPNFSLPSINGNIDYEDLNSVNINIANIYYYAVEINNIPELAKKDNYLINQNIKSIYILSNEYLNLLQINDSIYYECTLKSKSVNVSINNLFSDYINKVNNFTKLLTAPYCTISVTDYNTTYEIEPQACTTDITLLNNIIFTDGEIKGVSRLTNINGNEQQNIYIKQINGINANKTLYNSFDYDYLFNIDIPVYGLFVDSSTKQYLNNVFNNTLKENDLKANYENTARKINNSFENTTDELFAEYNNTLDSNATINANALRSNSTTYTNEINNATCAKDNALRSNANTQNVADNSALNSENVALNSNQVNYDNVVRSNTAITANSTATQAKNTAVTTANNALNSQQNSINIVRNTTSVNAQNDLQTAVTDTEIAGSAAQAVTGAIANMASGDLSGALLGSVSTIIGIGVQSAKTSAIIANNSAMLGANIQIDNNSVAETNLTLNTVNTASNTLIQTTTTNTVNASNQNASDTKTANDANAQATYNTNIANNAANKTTNDANANDNYLTSSTNSANKKTTADTNANATKNTADGNALNSYTTKTNNASNTQDTELENAQRSLIKDVENIYFSTTHNNLGELFAQSNPKLNTISNLYTQGFMISVNGLKEDDLNKAIAIFNRYGYMCDCRDIPTYSFTKLQVMQHYTYVEAENVTILNKTVPSKYAIIIEDILKRGTTIWSNPEEIGQYDLQNMGE